MHPVRYRRAHPHSAAMAVAAVRVGVVTLVVTLSGREASIL